VRGAAVVLLVAAGACASAENQRATSVTAAAPSSVVPQSATSWCVAISRDEAVRRAIALEAVRPRLRDSIDRAKLVTGSELMASGLLAGTEVAKDTRWWAVEREHGRTVHDPYTWEFANINANSGEVNGTDEEISPATDGWYTSLSVRRFNALPDHSSDCLSPSTVAP